MVGNLSLNSGKNTRRLIRGVSFAGQAQYLDWNGDGLEDMRLGTEDLVVRKALGQSMKMLRQVPVSSLDPEDQRSMAPGLHRSWLAKEPPHDHRNKKRRALLGGLCMQAGDLSQRHNNLPGGLGSAGWARAAGQDVTQQDFLHVTDSLHIWGLTTRSST